MDYLTEMPKSTEQPSIRESLNTAIQDNRATIEKQVRKAFESYHKDLEKKGKDRVDEKALEAFTQNLNSFLSALNVSVTFHFDQKSRNTVIKVIEKESHKVIRQIPSEQMLALAGKMDNLIGLLFNGKA